MDNLSRELTSALSVCEERIRISKANEVKYNDLTTKLANANSLLNNVRNTGNHMNAMYKNILFFLENKKEHSKAILENAIHSTSAIVKDSDLSNCSILLNNGKVKILNELGQNINSREGSAVRATMSLILRYTCLKAMPDKFQIMFLDEALATLSSSTSVNLREMLSAFSENIGILGIEQKQVLYEGLAEKVYSAVKQGKDTTIEEEKKEYLRNGGYYG